MDPSQQNNVFPAWPTNDGASNSGTLDNSESSKTYGGKNKASKDSDDGASGDPNNDGSRRSLAGAGYHQKLSIPILCRIAALIRKGEQFNFTITIENKKQGGLFDDIVFKSYHGDLFIQAKLKEDKSYAITWDDLTSTDESAQFSISKYLNSFLNNEWDKEKKPPVLVLCTNIGLHEDLKTSVEKYHFGTNIVDSILKFITEDAYYIDLNILKEETNNKLLQYLKEHSELGTLAKLLAQNIFHETVIEFRKDSVQTKHRSIIVNYIAERTDIQERCKVNKGFFEENKEFKNLFENEYQLQQKTRLIWDDIKLKRISLQERLHPKLKDQNNQSQCQNIIENLNLADFATQLAQHIYGESVITVKTRLFQNYQYIVENFIPKTYTYKNGYQKVPVVDEKTFNQAGFSVFKRLFDRAYENLLQPKPLDIWGDVENKGIRLKKEKQPNNCGKKKFPKHEENSKIQSPKQQKSSHLKLPKQVEDEQIKKFFKSFMIVCNTKHEEDQVVASIREKEVLLEDIKDPLFLAFIFNKLGMWILERMQDKSKPSIGRQDVDELFKYIKFLSQFSQWEGMSNFYCSILLNLGLQCKREVLQEFKLYENLKSMLAKMEDSKNVEFKVDVYEYNYPSWVVTQIIQSIDSKLFFYFLEDREFEPRKKQIMDVFGAMKSPLILVIECKSLPNITWYIEARAEGMSTKIFKKIILINQTFSTSKIERDLLVRDLTDDSRKKVINQTNIINFFGTEISTCELITDEDKLNLFLGIVQLSSESQMTRNKLKESFGKIEDVFIHREWERCDEKELRETPSKSFWSAREAGTTLAKLFPGTEIENKFSYNTFLEHNDLNNEMFDSLLLDRNSEYILPPGVDGNTQDQVQSNQTDRKVHVIFNEAGSGKSFYLTWLAMYLQDARPSWWVIKFNLNQFCILFDQFQNNDTFETIHELIAIRFLFQLVYLAWFVDNMFLIDSNEKFYNAPKIAETIDFFNGSLMLDKNKMKTVSSVELILLRTFVHKFNSKQIVILMDGFDEIVPLHKTVVLKLLSTLKTFDGIRKVYLSSRPYGLRNEVETALEDCACYRLVEFDQGDQYSFIDRYLLKHFDEYKSSDGLKQKRTCRVIFAILREILGDLMEIPLFISMGIELLIPMLKKYISIEEETVSKHIIEDCENSFEPLSMVENFVEKKLHIVNIEKTGLTIASSKTVETINNAKQKLEKVKETHSLLALYTIMSENDIEELLTLETQNTVLRYMENVKNGSEKFGLIEGVAKHTPIFHHRLFAEYFSAFWFYSNQKDTRAKDFLKREIYETNRRIEVRQFLDRMICRKNPLHMAVLEGSKSRISRTLAINPSSITARDDWGRTPFHLSPLLPPSEAEEHRKSFEYLLHWVDETMVNIQDTYFGWFPLDYAYCTDTVTRVWVRESLYNYDSPDWHIVLTLLNKGATIDTPEMLSKFRTTKFFIMIVDVLIIELFTERNYTPNFETFFTKLVKNLGSDKILNLKIPIDVPYQNTREGKTGIKIFTKLHQPIMKGSSSRPLLEFCIMVDSVMSKIIIENSNGCKLKRPNEYYFKLALKCRSINVLQYLITDHRQYLEGIKDYFERELWELLAYLQNDEQRFKSLFDEYCTRHNITCREDTPRQSNEWKSGFSQHDLVDIFPTKFEIRDDTGIDSGTEILIARALQLDNASAVGYLLHKSNTNLGNRFIRQIILNCKIKWYCQSSYHFLLDNCIDRTGTDEKGRNLLQFAAGYGDLNLVKCLMEHYDFQPKEINTKENNWNAFFYCASRCGWDDNSENIFAHMLEKDPVDCFSQLDAKGKSVFYYAAENNWRISHYIIQNKFEKQLEDLNTAQCFHLANLLKASGMNAKDLTCPQFTYLQFTHFNDQTKREFIFDCLVSIDEH